MPKNNKKHMPILVDLDSPSRMELIVIEKNTMKVKQIHCDGCVIGHVSINEITEEKIGYSSDSFANIDFSEYGGCVSITFANIVKTIVSDFKRNHLEENRSECVKAEKCIGLFEEIEKLLESVAGVEEERMKH